MNEVSDEEAQENIWRCECADDGMHINPTYHYFGCAYITWFAQRLREILDGAEDED